MSELGTKPYLNGKVALIAHHRCAIERQMRDVIVCTFHCTLSRCRHRRAHTQQRLDLWRESQVRV